MNLVDVLLNADVSKILKEETKRIEIERLSNVLGKKFEIEIKPIPAKRYTEIQSISVDVDSKTKNTNVNLYKMQMLTLCDGIKTPNFADENLLKHFNALTPMDLFNKLFLAGEIADISNEIGKLSGYDNKKNKKDIEEVKN